jgi:hypothetical protein
MQSQKLQDGGGASFAVFEPQHEGESDVDEGKKDNNESARKRRSD